MQRRTARGQAHIAPPTQSLHMPLLPENGSRLSHKNLGVTNRIWLLIGLILTILTLSHFVFSSTTPAPIHLPYSSAGLTPKTYLNTSGTAGPNPFPFCPVFGPGDGLAATYGALALSSSRMNVGSGERVQRVLARALAGEPVTISVLGGSVSACHGAGDDPVAPTCYPSMFFEWWNRVFPHPASELTNGAMRRTNSGYFGFCSTHHLPDVTDLVVIELDTEDPSDQDMMDHFETLVRSILIRPDHPAVLLLGHFSPQVHTAHGFAGPEHWHNVVAQFYDVPHVSTRPVLFPTYMKDQASISKYYTDPVLANPAGHRVLADVLIAYFQGQICDAWAALSGDSTAGPTAPAPDTDAARALFGGVGQRKGVPEPGREALDADGTRARPAAAKGGAAAARVPAGLLGTRPGGRAFEEVAPHCVAANDLINPLPPSLFYGSGWHVFHAPGALEGGGSALRATAHYWHSTLPTSKLRIPLVVGAGDVGVYYLREPVGVVGEGSAVECWVDDNYAGAKVIENAGDMDEAVPALVIIDRFVTRGSHYVECMLLGEEGEGVPMFKIIGVFST